MAIYKGKVKCREFSKVLHDILIEVGYTEISTEITTDGRVYVSSTTDDDKFYIRIQDPASRYLTVGVYEEYTPNVTSGLPGTFGNGILASCIIWNSSNADARVELNYIINATNKRVIVYVSGLPAEGGQMNSLTYIGLPNRVSVNDKDGRFAGLSYTSNGPYNNPGTFYSLRNRNLTALPAYLVDHYMPARSVGWGAKIFFSPMLIGSVAEGHRGTLDGIRIIEKVDHKMEIMPGDTFVHDGKSYMLITPTSHGYDTLHTGYDYLIEI